MFLNSSFGFCATSSKASPKWPLGRRPSVKQERHLLVSLRKRNCGRGAAAHMRKRAHYALRLCLVPWPPKREEGTGKGTREGRALLFTYSTLRQIWNARSKVSVAQAETAGYSQNGSHMLLVPLTHLVLGLFLGSKQVKGAACVIHFASTLQF